MYAAIFRLFQGHYFGLINDPETVVSRQFFRRRNPVALQRTDLWWLALHFGFQARDEFRSLQWGGVLLRNNPEETHKSFCGKERGSKILRGLDKS